MTSAGYRFGAVIAAALIWAFASEALAASPQSLSCKTAPPARCAGPACAFDAPGNAVEPETGRRYFLDFPCKLKRDEKLLFILNLHGAGLGGDFQRRYFPAAAFKDKYRLVVATPTAASSFVIDQGLSPARLWQAGEDDAYLHNIVREVYDRFGQRNIHAFWLAGHSYGGMTANRLVCDGFFADKVDGWLSLSGGRIGPAKVPPGFGPAHPPPSGPGRLRPGDPQPGAAITPTCDFNYIFETGEKEIAALPATSPWADRFGCGSRVEQEVVDKRPGLVDRVRPGPQDPARGRAARPGRARIYTWSGCRDGRLVADVVRLDKGHTEGLEPRITEVILQMMLVAPGGKAEPRG